MFYINSCFLGARECLGHHRKGIPGIGHTYEVLLKYLMSDNTLNNKRMLPWRARPRV